MTPVDGGPGGPDPARRPASDLRTRAISAVVMMVLALGALWVGGIVFAVFAAATVALVMREWANMSGPFPGRMTDWAAVAFVAVSVVASMGQPLVSVGAVAAVTAAVSLFGAVVPRMHWLGWGIVYAALPGIAAVAIRGTDGAGAASPGLLAIAFVFVTVWATDSAAYFVGRRLGGPKLMPRVSPKKTWSGALGGLAAAVLAGMATGAALRGGDVVALGAVALALSVVSQAGDLAESAMKRHFGVKDSGRLIPGHGGVMDRVDGLVVALALAAAIGWARAGEAGVAEGLLVW